MDAEGSGRELLLTLWWPPQNPRKKAARGYCDSISGNANPANTFELSQRRRCKGRLPGPRRGFWVPSGSLSPRTGPFTRYREKVESTTKKGGVYKPVQTRHVNRPLFGDDEVRTLLNDSILMPRGKNAARRFFPLSCRAFTVPSFLFTVEVFCFRLVFFTYGGGIGNETDQILFWKGGTVSATDQTDFPP